MTVLSRNGGKGLNRNQVPMSTTLAPGDLSMVIFSEEARLAEIISETDWSELRPILVSPASLLNNTQEFVRHFLRFVYFTLIIQQINKLCNQYLFFLIIPTRNVYQEII